MTQQKQNIVQKCIYQQQRARHNNATQINAQAHLTIK